MHGHLHQRLKARCVNLVKTYLCLHPNTWTSAPVASSSANCNFAKQYFTTVAKGSDTNSNMSIINTNSSSSSSSSSSSVTKAVSANCGPLPDGGGGDDDDEMEEMLMPGPSLGRKEWNGPSRGTTVGPLCT